MTSDILPIVHVNEAKAAPWFHLQHSNQSHWDSHELAALSLPMTCQYSENVLLPKNKSKSWHVDNWMKPGLHFGISYSSSNQPISLRLHNLKGQFFFIWINSGTREWLIEMLLYHNEVYRWYFSLHLIHFSKCHMINLQSYQLKWQI